MIQFFRKIRQKLIAKSNFSKYLVYAFGEIALVMIGILLALQVNNWNEAQKSERVRLSYLEFLKSDIESDIKSIDRTMAQNDRFENYGRQLLDFIEGKQPELDKLSVARATKFAVWNPTYALNKSTYNDLISTGNIALFKDMQLKRLLDNYYTGNDWGKNFYKRIEQTLWHDFWNERIKYVDGTLLLNENDTTLSDIGNYYIDIEGIKSSFPFKQNLKIILGHRKTIRGYQSTDKRRAEELLKYILEN
ncbi:DUF6090 family protein [Algoriphagus sp. SE2]|uniref:DUF6090 family protein n=1 Tax=Algoriphagus sp. SE2 TaxID=3141536 RepID=UPI0031CD656E